jgi:hypothetical protein
VVLVVVQPSGSLADSGGAEATGSLVDTFILVDYIKSAVSGTPAASSSPVDSDSSVAFVVLQPLVVQRTPV